MSANAKARRRTKPSFALRVRSFWLIALLAACILIALGSAFAGAPQLRVRSVDATVPPNSPVTKSDVLAAAGIDANANLWLLGTSAIRRRLEAIPYVATASVHRRQFPQPAVTLAVTLRAPTGCVNMPGGAVTIDASQRVLQTGCASPALPLVDAGVAVLVAPGQTLNNPDVNRLLDDARTIGATVPVRIVRRDRFGSLQAVDTHGVLLEFGADADLPAKLALVEPIRRSAQGRPLRAIDLRAPATPVIQFP